jgi:demethylspheroidene O-methyltransferase
MVQRSSRFDLSTKLLSWWYNQKNKLIKNIRVQDFFARFPITSRVARKEGEAIFQLMTGFVDTQILFTFVKSGALRHLEAGSLSIEELSDKIGINIKSTEILCRAGYALGFVRLKSKKIFLARRGALILSLPGMMELIDHHSILYEDLLDPISFFRGEKETKLSQFWPYVFGKAKSLDSADVSRYSDLMSKSQFMVARDTIASIKVSKGTKWLDVGGGSGAFAKELLNKHPSVKISVFDIPGSSADSEPHKFIPGSFFTDQIPVGFDTVSCVRVLYDHDDQTVSDLLLKIHSSLPTGGRIVISEPMLGELSPNKWGDTYFATYTYAMKTGKTRSPSQVSELLEKIGFSKIKIFPSRRPFVTTVIEAHKN